MVFLICQLVLKQKLLSWCCPKDNTISNKTLVKENLRLFFTYVSITTENWKTDYEKRQTFDVSSYSI